MEKEQKNMNDILPADLIQRIFLMLPAKQLGRLRCVSKLWHSLISDPHFAHSHFNLHSATSSPSCLFVKDDTEAYFVHLDPLINVSSASASASSVTEVSFPFKKKAPSEFLLMGCCRGFVLLSRHKHFLVVWNPLTGSSKRISYSHIVSRSKIPGFMFLYGFGYDDSQDDYLVVLAWQQDSNPEGPQLHLDCFSLRNNSWINLDSALPKPSGAWRDWKSCGLFLNGAIHWLSYSVNSHIDAVLVFDLKERSFSKISVPEQVVRRSANLIVLGECLALDIHDNHKYYIWVMKAYRVQSSWTLMYEIPYCNSEALCLSNGYGSDIILLEHVDYTQMRLAKYNASGELLQHFSHPSFYYYNRNALRKFHLMYTESLLPFPSDLKDKDKKKQKKTAGR